MFKRTHPEKQKGLRNGERTGLKDFVTCPPPPIRQENDAPSVQGEIDPTACATRDRTERMQSDEINRPKQVCEMANAPR